MKKILYQGKFLPSQKRIDGGLKCDFSKINELKEDRITNQEISKKKIEISTESKFFKVEVESSEETNVNDMESMKIFLDQIKVEDSFEETDMGLETYFSDTVQKFEGYKISTKPTFLEVKVEIPEETNNDEIKKMNIVEGFFEDTDMTFETNVLDTVIKRESEAEALDVTEVKTEPPFTEKDGLDSSQKQFSNSPKRFKKCSEDLQKIPCIFLTDIREANSLPQGEKTSHSNLTLTDKLAPTFTMKFSPSSNLSKNLSFKSTKKLPVSSTEISSPKHIQDSQEDSEKENEESETEEAESKKSAEGKGSKKSRRKPAQCPECLKTYHGKDSLKRHMLIHIGNKFTCTICNREISTKYYLGVHMRLHDSEKLFKCDKCEKGFVSRSSLRVHKETTHNDERPFSCDICKKTFKAMSGVRYHMRVHTGKRKMECKICKKVLAHKMSLEYHMSTHLSEKMFKCKICLRHFSRHNDLQSHLKTHANAREHKCPHCDKCYNLRNVLSSHIRIAHTRESIHKCDLCTRVFSNKVSLEVHMNHHSGKRPYVCPTCGIDFAGKYQLRIHQTTHKLKFICNVCNENFVYKLDLKRHMLIHFPRKPNLCKICGLKCSNPASLVNHYRTHTGERPFVCNFCGKGFAIKCSLKSHIYLHTKEYPYACQMCGKGFAMPNQLKKHLNVH